MLQRHAQHTESPVRNRAGLTWWWHGYRHKVARMTGAHKNVVRFLCCKTEKVVRDLHPLGSVNLPKYFIMDHIFFCLRGSTKKLLLINNKGFSRWLVAQKMPECERFSREKRLLLSENGKVATICTGTRQLAVTLRA